MQVAMEVDVSVLYDLCQRIDEDEFEKSENFQRCIEAIKSADVSTKKFAIQIVLRFFDTFPDKRAVALNTLMTELTHPDTEVQKLIIKGLPSTCHRNADYVDQVGDILTQLLSIPDKQELILVKKSLSLILLKHPKATILAMYTAVINAETIEEKVAMLKFMDERVKRMSGELTPFMKKKIASVYQTMLVSATPDEIEVVLHFLGKSHQITEKEKQITYSAALENLLEKGIRLDQHEDSDEPNKFNDVVNNVVKVILLIHCTDRHYVLSNTMTKYLFSKFGKLHRIHPSDRKDIMKVLATVTYLGNYEDPEECSGMVMLFDYLKRMLPDPCPTDCNMDYSYVEQKSERGWDLEFSELELVSVVMYNILKRNPCLAKNLAEVSDTWKPRFQYLVNVIRVFTRRLKRKLDAEAKNGEEIDIRNSHLLMVANNVGLIANCFLVDICNLYAKISPSWVLRRRREASFRREGIKRKRRRYA